jgi:glutathione S-transferase
MKLYYAPGACSLAPHIVAREAGVPIQLEKVDLGAKKTDSGKDYRAINPKGYVPALEIDGGEVLTEAGALIQYLGDRNPGHGLMPAPGTLDRYREVEWITFISSELHKGFGPLWDPAVEDDAKQKVKEKLATRFGYVEKTLAQRPFLMGATFTAADAYLFTIMNWSGMVKVDLSPYPRTQDFMKRVGARPKVQEALKAEGLVK